MKNIKPFARALFFLFLLACLLTGLAGTMRVPVRAAPKQANALDVVINEIAWAGTAAAGADEWIELYNPGVSDIDLSGWLLVSTSDGTPSITLTGIIPAGGYYLLERTDDTTISDIAADQIYTGDLLIGGETLELRDSTLPTPNVIDTANGDGGVWPAGDSGTDSSMERIDSTASDTDANWGTNDGVIINGLDANSNPINGTPKQPNSTTYAPEIVISEVAWAGTQASVFDEWIELYNDGSSTVDLTNWRIQTLDGDPPITLSGNIAPGSYLVLERGSQNVVQGVTGLVYSANLLDDTGETLYLLDDTSSIVDTVNSNGGVWPAGTSSPDFRTMERTGNVPDSDYVWLTFDDTTFIAQDAGGNDIYGTPGAAWGFNNLSPTGTPTNTPVPPTSTPTGALTVLINEVAWAGTDASSSDEWIELYNPSANLVDLTGWTLKAGDGSPSIALVGSIPSGGYFLLERTDDMTVSDIPADQIYTGDMSNSGEILRLYDPSNVVVDSANLNGGGWPAGSSTTRGSMERRGTITDSDTAWITNTGVVANGLDANSDNIKGTPKQANWALTVTATPSPVPTVYKTSTPSYYGQLPPPPPLVAINEFVPRPGRDWNNDGFINTGDEYIELINHGVIDVNLSGYRLDDEANVGSEPYRLPSITLKPGERIVFYGSETGLLLSDGGDGVRLLKSNGQLADAYNYFVVKFPDQSFCRLPDNGGLDDWNTNCYPTPGLRNSLSGSLLGAPVQNGVDEPLCPIADTLPVGFVIAECDAFGHNIWSRYYWDEFGWYDEVLLPTVKGKWDIYAD